MRDIGADFLYDHVRAAGSYGHIDLVLYNAAYGRVMLGQVKSTKERVYYTSGNPHEFQHMKSCALNGIEAYYFVRWKNMRAKGDVYRWEVYNPAVTTICRHDEGTPLKNVLEGEILLERKLW